MFYFKLGLVLFFATVVFSISFYVLYRIFDYIFGKILQYIAKKILKIPRR